MHGDTITRHAGWNQSTSGYSSGHDGTKICRDVGTSTTHSVVASSDSTSSMVVRYLFLVLGIETKNKDALGTEMCLCGSACVDRHWLGRLRRWCKPRRGWNQQKHRNSSWELLFDGHRHSRVKWNDATTQCD